MKNVPMSKCTLYKVIGQVDTTEGKGGTYVVGYTPYKAVAADLAKGKGCMGDSGRIEEIPGIWVHHPDDATQDQFAILLGPEQVHLLTSHQIEQLRADALSKLTPEDRKILGLS